MSGSGRIIVSPQGLLPIENQRATLLLGLLVFGRDEEALAGPALQNFPQVTCVSFPDAPPQSLGCLRAEESREGVVSELQGVICQVVWVSQNELFRQACQVVEFAAPLRRPNGNQEELDGFLLELGQDVVVDLPCKLLTEGSPHGAGKHEDAPLIIFPQVCDYHLFLTGSLIDLYALKSLVLVYPVGVESLSSEICLGFQT